MDAWEMEMEMEELRRSNTRPDQNKISDRQTTGDQSWGPQNHSTADQTRPFSYLSLHTIQTAKMTKVWYIVSALVFVVHTHGAPAPDEVLTPELPPSPELPPTETSSPVPPALANGELSVPDCKNTTDVYDMSQNGSENYKVNVKGFTFLLAGSDTVLGAAMLMSGLADTDKNNPTPAVGAAAPIPAAPESTDKMSRLMHLIKQISHGGRSIKVNLLNNQEGEKQYKRFLRNIK